MKPLQTHLKVLHWLCACPFNKNTSHWKRLAYILFTIFVIILNCCVNISSIAYSIKFINLDLELGLFAFSQFTAYVCSTYVAILIPLLLRYKIMNIFNKLYEIYHMSKYFSLQTFYMFLLNETKKN